MQSNNWFRDEARRQLQARDDKDFDRSKVTIVVDKDAEVSAGKGPNPAPGAWVQAWCWIPYLQSVLEKKDVGTSEEK